jgi:hypothetical protein
MGVVAKFLGVFLAGLLAGIMVYGWMNLAPVFHEVPMDVHLLFRVKLMDHNSIIMPALMGVVFISASIYAYTARFQKAARNFAIASAVLAIVVFLVTRFGNVPINWQIRSWSASALPSNAQELLERWDFFHSIRTLSAVSCFLCLVAATHFDNNIR